MTVAVLLAQLVPRPWSVAQAHRAERRLRQLIDAIWYVHGDAMAAAVLAPARPAAPPPRQRIHRPWRRAAPVRRSLLHLVPRAWSGEQALRVVHVLHLAIAAAWEVADDEPPVWISVPVDSSMDEDDEIPF